MVTNEIRSKIISGIKWNTLSLVATRATDFIVKLILARLLLPEAYGVVGMAMLVISFLTIFSDMGLFHALVQKKPDELTEARYSSSFWFLLLLGSISVCCFFLFFSQAGAAFYNEPQLVPILNALSIYMFFNILNIIPRVILTHQLDFKSLVQITYLGSILSSIVAIAMAFLEFGVWSLVAKSMISSFVVTLSYWIKVGWRPKFIFKHKLLMQLARFSIFTQLNACFYFFLTGVDSLIISKFSSAHLLGIYTLAYTLSETLRSQLYFVFNRVFFPVYSKIQDDKAQIKHYYLKIMRLTALVTFPLSILFIGLADDIILISFGEKWIAAAEPLRILSVASIIFAISGTPAEVLKSIGKPSISFNVNFITLLVAVPLMYFGLKYYGLTGVGYAVCINYTLSRLVYHHFMKKYIGVTDADVYQALKGPFIAAASMLGTIYLINQIELSMLVTVFIAGLAGGIVYCVLLMDDLRKILKQVKQAV